MFKSPFEHIITLISSYSCVICDTAGEPLCEGCFFGHFGEPDYRCYMCNKLTKQGRVCKSCKSNSKLRHVWWLGSYGGVLKDLVLQAKYQRNRQAVRVLGGYLGLILPYLNENTIVVPVPTASRRVRLRGYDQALIMAKSLSGRKNLVLKQCLIRQGQVELIGRHRSERLRLMANSFRLKPNIDLSGTTVLLVDDVLTTGASLESAARLLRSAGAAHVDAAVIARKQLS
jgi:ComF family protein